MKKKDIILNSNNEELIPYLNPSWLHSIEYTNISKTILGYIPLHWHEELQFVVVKEGTVELRILGNKIKLSKGTGFFINSGVIHEIHAKTLNASFLCWNIGISLFDQYIQTTYILPLIQEGNTPYVILDPLKEKHNRIIQAILMSYDTYVKKEKGFELTVTSQYLICLKELLDELAFHSTNRFPTYDQRVKDILEYIHQHYQEKINLQTLAEIANLSKSEANRLFKKHVGRTPFTYILDYRLERSINLLTGTRSSITDISFECGFSSVSYFIEKFKETFYITPKQFRDQKDKES